MLPIKASWIKDPDAKEAIDLIDHSLGENDALLQVIALRYAGYLTADEASREILDILDTIKFRLKEQGRSESLSVGNDYPDGAA